MSNIPQDIAQLRQEFNDWAVSTEFNRNGKNPVDVEDQMALRDAHELFVEFNIVRVMERK